MKITFDVTDSEGTKHKVLAGQADLIAMERKYDVPVSALGDSPRMEYIAFVAWNAMRRQHMTTMGFDEWVEDCELEQVADEGNG
jgi:hypothetical protein